MILTLCMYAKWVKLSTININQESKKMTLLTCFWYNVKSKSNDSDSALSTSRAALRFNHRIKNTTATASTTITVTAPKTNTINSNNILFSSRPARPVHWRSRYLLVQQNRRYCQKSIIFRNSISTNLRGLKRKRRA